MKRWQYAGHTVGRVLDTHSAPPGTLSSPLCPALSSKLQVSFINCIQGFPCLPPSMELTSGGSRRRWQNGRTGGLPPYQATSCHFMRSPTKAVVGIWAPGTASFSCLLRLRAGLGFPDALDQGAPTFPCQFSATLPSPL